MHLAQPINKDGSHFTSDFLSKQVICFYIIALLEKKINKINEENFYTRVNL